MTDESEQELREILGAVVDPEVGVSIVDLGLVYRIEQRGDVVVVELTMTSAACPMSETVVADARRALHRARPGCEVRVSLVWDPPWDPSMMNERARMILGWD